MRSFLLTTLLCLFVTFTQAQIGYQVTLLNSSTGEPRANETVSVTVTITNSENATVCSETKSATTNDFGILSVAVGNAETFAETDWTKLPFYISATVDGVLIGKTQLLSVPIAEYAKKSGVLTRDFLNGKRVKPVGGPSNYSITFTKNKVIRDWGDESPDRCNYEIIGNIIIYYFGVADRDAANDDFMVIYYANDEFYCDGYIWK